MTLTKLMLDGTIDLHSKPFDEQTMIKLQIFENYAQSFTEEVERKVLTLEIKNNLALYNYTLEQGHISRHASDCLRSMKRKNQIEYRSTSPLVNHENVYKKKVLLEYKLVDHLKIKIRCHNQI